MNRCEINRDAGVANAFPRRQNIIITQVITILLVRTIFNRKFSIWRNFSGRSYPVGLKEELSSYLYKNWCVGGKRTLKWESSAVINVLFMSTTVGGKVLHHTPRKQQISNLRSKHGFSHQPIASKPCQSLFYPSCTFATLSKENSRDRFNCKTLQQFSNSHPSSNGSYRRSNYVRETSTIGVWYTRLILLSDSYVFCLLKVAFQY